MATVESDRRNDKLLPLSYTAYKQDYQHIEFLNVIFLEDFGPFIKDEKINCIALFPGEAKIVEYSIDGMIMRMVKIKFTPA